MNITVSKDFDYVYHPDLKEFVISDTFAEGARKCHRINRTFYKAARLYFNTEKYQKYIFVSTKSSGYVFIGLNDDLKTVDLTMKIGKRMVSSTHKLILSSNYKIYKIDFGKPNVEIPEIEEQLRERLKKAYSIISKLKAINIELNEELKLYKEGF